MNGKLCKVGRLRGEWVKESHAGRLGGGGGV
jgi:hypothetical protein